MCDVVKLGGFSWTEKTFVFVLELHQLGLSERGVCSLTASQHLHFKSRNTDTSLSAVRGLLGEFCEMYVKILSTQLDST